MKTSSTIIIIPAYNESANLPSVFADLQTYAPEYDWLVVDDNSRDDTSEIARSFGATVLNLPLNLGVGGTVQAGYMYAWEKGYDFAVQFDGDGQHRGIHLEELLEPLRQGHADMVIGSRYLGGIRYRQIISRQIGTKIFSLALKVLFRKKFSDPTSGLRAVKNPLLAFFARHYPQGWLGDTIESLVEAARHGFSIHEIPVVMRQRKHGSSATGFFKGIFYSFCLLLAIAVDVFEKKHAIPHTDSSEEKS